MPDDDDCVQNDEWRMVVKNAKKLALRLYFQEGIALHENVP